MEMGAALAIGWVLGGMFLPFEGETGRAIGAITVLGFYLIYDQFTDLWKPESLNFDDGDEDSEEPDTEHLAPNQPTPPFKLYSSRQVGLAAFLGGPLGGALLLAINFRRLGRRGSARNSILLGVLAMFAFIALALALPGPAQAFPLTLLAAVAGYKIATWLQDEEYEAHIGQGGRKVSTWNVAGLGVTAALCGTVACVAIFAHEETRGAYHQFRGGNHHRAGRLDESIASYRRSAELLPEYAQPHFGIGNVLVSQGDPQGAIGEYEKAIKLRPEYTPTLNQIARLYATTEDLAVRDPQKALDYATKAVELDAEPVPAHLDTLAEAHYANGHFDEAIEIEKRALSMNPGYEFYKEQLTKFEQASAAQGNR